MPGAENLIYKYVYSTPENIYCRSRWFGRYWCGLRWVEHTMGVFVGFTYPSVSEGDLAKIYSCAAEAGLAATPPIAAAVLACGVTGGTACVPAVAAAIPAANELLRAIFFYCLKDHTDLSDEVISQCEIGIYQKELDYYLTSKAPSNTTHCKICCKGFTGEYICRPYIAGNQSYGKWAYSTPNKEESIGTTKKLQNKSPDDSRCILCCKGITGEDVCIPIG
ncbi:hypothetical protein [Bacillus halotolerans]|uniref:hypothetical protein n=2 Tax=Bacillus halotolerans TaxID=260554 RepID=UPI000AFA4FB2|nr:hypothetical protein [Bacillus halotolerans]MBL4968644.1 hypothetical protein [Bacillus halotolerans]MBL4972705.1 hypothetical protein [Bacillus halotolerans]